MNKFNCEKFDRIINNDIGGYDKYSAEFVANIDNNTKYLVLTITDTSFSTAVYDKMRNGNYETLLHFTSYMLKTNGCYSRNVNIDEVKRHFINWMKNISYTIFPSITHGSIYAYDGAREQDEIYLDIKFKIDKINGVALYCSRPRCKFTFGEILDIIEMSIFDESGNSVGGSEFIRTNSSNSTKQDDKMVIDGKTIKDINKIINPDTVVNTVTWKQSMEED